ncbi:MAG: hypothetical protein HOP00_06730 [Nitrospira sp.]|nr:hypothetical protein [Nitrospira sp.]
MEDRLKYVLDLCIDWVKYAEKKNAALLVAASGLVLSLVGHFPDKTSSSGIRACLWIGCVSLVLSALICLVSFIPQIDFPWITSRRKTSSEDNLFFFGHIADYSASELVEALYQGEGIQPASNKLQLDLAGQIIVNARVSLKKFRLFTVATWLATIGVALVICAAVQILAQ